MTTFTSISNPSVAVGGIPSSATVTALRDNPLAIAEGANGAPVMVSGWHPVDKVTIGDGKTGTIYDFAVNGLQSSVVTPDFEDGYEYRLYGDNLSSSAGSGSLIVEAYFDPFAAYEPSITIGVTGSNDDFIFDITYSLPRVSSPYHLWNFVAYRDATLVTPPSGIFNDATPQKILRARVRLTTGSLDQGKIYLYRRREYTSLP